MGSTTCYPKMSDFHITITLPYSPEELINHSLPLSLAVILTVTETDIEYRQHVQITHIKQNGRYINTRILKN